jgi:putative redox protein
MKAATASLPNTQPRMARSLEGTETIWHEFRKFREHPDVRAIRARASLAEPEGNRAQFVVETGSGHPILVDGTSAGPGPRPVELVAAALAGCVAYDLTAIVCAKHQAITAYEVRVEMEQAERPPQAFVAVRIHHVFTGRGIDPAVVSEAIKTSEEKSSAIETMLRYTASITTTFEIVEESSE